jgi:hypothetical protein
VIEESGVVHGLFHQEDKAGQTEELSARAEHYAAAWKRERNDPRHLSQRHHRAISAANSIQMSAVAPGDKPSMAVEVFSPSITGKGEFCGSFDPSLAPLWHISIGNRDSNWTYR